MNGPIIVKYFRGPDTSRADHSGDRRAWSAAWPARLWSWVLRAYRARRARAALAALDDRMLRDIGVSRHEIEGVAGDGAARERRRLQSLASCRQQLSRPGTCQTRNDARPASTPIDLANIRARSRRGAVSESTADPAIALHVADPDYLRNWFENSRGCVIHPFT